jgi:hypothetical protein
MRACERSGTTDALKLQPEVQPTGRTIAYRPGLDHLGNGSAT